MERFSRANFLAVASTKVVYESDPILVTGVS
jgi:hypothetical protein